MKRLLLVVALAACSPTPGIEETAFAPALGVDLAASQRLPSGMYVRDLSPGSGAAATAGQSVTMRYTGWLADGTQFDSNVTRTPGYTFTLGAGAVIAGWDLGVPGMQPGGTRQLIIPPSLGYGASGYGPIPGDAVLVFSVTMVSAR